MTYFSSFDWYPSHLHPSAGVIYIKDSDVYHEVIVKPHLFVWKVLFIIEKWEFCSSRRYWVWNFSSWRHQNERVFFVISLFRRYVLLNEWKCFSFGFLVIQEDERFLGKSGILCFFQPHLRENCFHYMKYLQTNTYSPKHHLETRGKCSKTFEDKKLL